MPGWPTNTGSWLLYIASLVLFAAAWVVWERSTPAAVRVSDTETSTEPKVGRPTLATRFPQLSSLRITPSKVEWAVMGGLLLLALLLRLPGLDNAPPGLWFDEAENGLAGRNLLAPDALHPTFLGDFTQMGAFYFYILGIVIKVFGTTLIWPLRLLPAVAGALLAPMLYLIASRLYGWRVGLCAGVLLAVSAWNITFSRFGMASMPTIALDVGVYLCLLQGLRMGRLGYYAGAGVMMGLALQMYYASQLVPVVLLLVFLYRLATERMRFWRAVRGGMVLLALGLIMGFLPVATFAAQHPEVYTARTGTVSIFTPEGSDNHPDALGISLSKHALMFNYSGDINGRHNIPGDPMLDWWTGAFFLSGLGVCLLRIRRWHYFFPFVWFLASMSGGVLTVVFEAPQAHRTLESSVITALIAGIFLGELWKALTPGAVPSTRYQVPSNARALATRYLVPGISALVLALLVVVGLTNADRYFNRQMNNVRVWQDMLGPDREIGRLAAQYGATHTVFVSAIKAEYPPANYAAPGANIIEWPGMYSFPLTEERDTEVILTPPDGYDVSSIKRIYPNAVVSVLHGPNDIEPELYSINIPASDIVAARGVHATLYPGDASKAPVDLTLPSADFDWTSKEARDAQVRTVRLSTTLKVPSYAGYRFRVASGDVATGQDVVMVDGFDVTAGTPITLGKGLHSVVVTGTVGSAAGATTTSMLWNGGAGDPTQPIGGNLLLDPRKVEPRGLTAVFRKSDVFDTEPVDGRVDPTISFYFHLTPLQRPYTAEWTGKLYAPVAGSYTFSTEQISHSQLFIDGQVTITNSQNNTSLSETLSLTQGLHDIRIRFEDLEGFSHIYLYWTPPGMSDRYVIPSAFLLPAMGSYPAQPESGPWPSLDQADDTDWSRSAEAQGNAGQVARPAQPPLPAPPVAPAPTIEQKPTAEQPTKQAAVPTAAGQTKAQAIQPILTLGIGEAATGERFERPKAAAVDDVGNIYLYTESDTSIRKFGSDGKLITKWTVQGKDGSSATEISALVIKDGKLLALDAATAEIISYALDGSGGERTQLCVCFFPRGLAVSKDGNFWVADTGGSKVIKVTPGGHVLTTVGGKGSDLGQFVEPAGVWESPDGTLFVADIGNSRIQSFEPNLKPVAAWSMGFSIARDGNRVTGDKDGVLVTELESKAVVRYSPDGKETGRWIYNGLNGPAVPAGITPAGDGKFLVLYPLDNLALIFSPGK